MKEEHLLDESVVKMITFKRDLNAQDFRDMREVFGNKLVEEGKRHVVVVFDDEVDMLTFKRLAESGFYTR